MYLKPPVIQVVHWHKNDITADYKDDLGTIEISYGRL